MSFSQLPYLIAVPIMVLSAFIWLFSGALVLNKIFAMLFQKTLTFSRLNFLAAWLTWPLWAGSIAVGILLLNIPLAPALVLLQLAVLGAGLMELYFARTKIYSLKISAGELKFLGVIFFYIFCMVCYAASPSTKVDQINYHLAVSKFALNPEGFLNAIDPHLRMTGMFEFALAWPRSLFSNDYFCWGFGQVLTYIYATGGLILIGWYLKLKSSALFIPIVLIILINLPESLVFTTFKSDGIIFMLVLACIAVLYLEKNPTAYFFIFVANILCIKFTGIHPVLVLTGLGIFKYKGKLFKDLRNFLFFIPFGLFLIKNAVLLSNPFYPAALDYFTSPYSDQQTKNYWLEIADLQNADIFSGLVGLKNLLIQSKEILFMIFLLSAYLFKFKRVNLPEFLTTHRLTFLFLFFYVALWPLFFSGTIYFRFVLSAMGPIVLIFITMLQKLDLKIATDKRFVVFLSILSIAFCGIDVAIQKIWKWRSLDISSQVALSEHAVIFQTFSDLKLPAGLVLGSSPGKYLFNQKYAYAHEHAGPLERKIYRNFREKNPGIFSEENLSAVITEPGTELENSVLGMYSCAKVTSIGSAKIYIDLNCAK